MKITLQFGDLLKQIKLTYTIIDYNATCFQHLLQIKHYTHVS